MTAGAADLRGLLRAVLGPAGLLTQAAEVAPYLVDHRRLYQGAALAVALPRSVAEVSQVLALCDAHRVGVVPHGGNTGYCGGATPDASGRQLVLALARLNRIRSVDPANDSMMAEAGCTLAQVQAAAAPAERFFPLSLGSEGSCQLGGNLSTNAGGTNVLRYGMARELVLGLEVVLADGRVLELLSALRKDNTGYDVKSLFMGAEGTLGIITAASVKLYPTSATAPPPLSPSPTCTPRWRCSPATRASSDRVSSFELIPRAALQLACAISRARRIRSAPYPWYVLCELSCRRHRCAAWSAAGVPRRRPGAGLAPGCGTGRQRARARGAVEDPRDDPGGTAARGPRHQARHRRARGPAGRFHGGRGGMGRAECPRGAPDRLRACRRWQPALQPQCRECRGGTGALARTQIVRRAIHDLVAGFGGSFSAEHGIGALKVDELERYTSPVELSLMRAIKQALDPHNTMNPGKVLRLP